MPYLIDGHNVIAALPDIDLEEAHDEAKFILKLRRWTARQRRKAIVIFDGGLPGGYARGLSTPDVKVIFAARHHSIADRIIKARLRKLPDAGNWTVVSSDREILDQARECGAKVISAQEFAERLNRPQQAQQEKPERISAREVAEWLEIFPELPESTPASPTKSALPQKKPPQKSKPRRAAQVAQKAPTSPKPRSARSIGDQLGVKNKTQAQQPAPENLAEKPSNISEAEVAEWLEIFPEPPPSPTPTPRAVRKAARKKKRQPLKVKKEPQSALSRDEVEAWLDIFEEADPEPPKEAAAKPEPAEKAATGKPSGRSRLAKHKAKHNTETEAEKSTLSDEESALWRRLFGEEDR